MKVRHSIVLALIACSAIFGLQSALAAKPHHHRRGHHRQSGFAILNRPSAKHSDARQQFLGIPSNAILAESVGGTNIFVFQRNSQAQTCVADEEGARQGGWACSPTKAAEREGVSLIHPKHDGTQKLILLVPNGVKTVSVTSRNNTTVTVSVTNNVAVTEGNLVAYHFVTPSGADVSIPLEGK